MSDNIPREGDAQHPVSEDHYNYIIEVGWGGGWGILDIDTPDGYSPFPNVEPFGTSLEALYNPGDVIDADDIKKSLTKEFPYAQISPGPDGNLPDLGEISSHREDFYSIAIDLGPHPPLGFLWEPFVGGQGLATGVEIDHYSHTHSDFISLAMQAGYDSQTPEVGAALADAIAGFNPIADGYTGGEILASGVVECIEGLLRILGDSSKPGATVACDGSGLNVFLDQTVNYMQTHVYRISRFNASRTTFLISLGLLGARPIVMYGSTFANPFISSYSIRATYRRYKGKPVFRQGEQTIEVEDETLLVSEQTISYPYYKRGNLFKITRKNDMEAL